MQLMYCKSVTSAQCNKQEILLIKKRGSLYTYLLEALSCLSKMFQPRMGEVREIFGMVGVTTYWDFNLSRELILYKTADIYRAGGISVRISPTTCIINVRWWQHLAAPGSTWQHLAAPSDQATHGYRMSFNIYFSYLYDLTWKTT
jgi:hypothetical protein